MRRSHAHLLLLSSAIHTSTTAISLSDFQPSSTNLTPACEAAYKAELPNCVALDFGASNSCSTQCINSLVDIQVAVYIGCSDNPQNHNYLIGTFLDGHGIEALCANVVVTTAQSSTPTAQVTSTSIVHVTSVHSVFATTVISSTQVEPTSTTSCTTTSSPTSTSTTPSSSSTSTTTSSTPSFPLPPLGSVTYISTTTAATFHTATSAPSDATATAEARACQKGSNAAHQGSLMDNYCSDASRLLADADTLRHVLFLGGVAMLGWVLVGL